VVASVGVPHPIRSLHQDAGDRPFIVIWEVTRACELACAHCRADAVRVCSLGEITDALFEVGGRYRRNV